MANMIKFFKGLEASLPTSGVNGALYITTDEGAIYLGTGTGMKRLGDFVQVDNVAALPEKAHESCLYYCVAENILAKWNGTEWKQINKQPTADEMKTLLGLGSLAYKSIVAEADLDSTLKEKVNAAAEGNHSHANKALLDTYTQTEADLADAVTKKHTHANADELAKFVDGDKAKYDAVVADHLTSADKTTLEDGIKEAKKAGTDANTNIEAYKVTNDARVLAVEEDIAEITDGTNGILVQAKAYADGKDTAIDAAKKAGDDAQADLNAYKTSNNEALAGVKATADAAAVKTEVEAELAKKVDKVEGKELIATSEIDRLATLHNYDDTQVKADIAKKADSATMTTELGKKVDKVEGYSLVADTEIARLANVDNYDDEEVRGLIGDNADAIEGINNKIGEVPADKTVVQLIADAKSEATYDDTELAGKVAALETESAKHAIKTEVEGALALKADKSVVDAMYTNTQIDGFVAEVKKYADDNDADTKYGIVYDSENKKIKLVEGGTDVEIDASAFIKDGMISNVTIGDDNDLVITFNTDAGKENIVLPLDQLVDIYTGVEGARIKVTVNADKSIGADLVTGSIGKDYLDAGVKASLALADSAIQAHQDISHLATTEALNGVDAKFANYTNTTDMNAKFDLKADKTQVATDIATAKSGAEAEAARLDGVLKAELQGEINAKANAADVYAKTETFTKDEVNAAIAAAVEAAHTWGEF